MCFSFTHAVNSATRASLQDNSFLAPPAPELLIFPALNHPTCLSDSCASLTLRGWRGNKDGKIRFNLKSKQNKELSIPIPLFAQPGCFAYKATMFPPDNCIYWVCVS